MQNQRFSFILKACATFLTVLFVSAGLSAKIPLRGIYLSNFESPKNALECEVFPIGFPVVFAEFIVRCMTDLSLERVVNTTQNFSTFSFGVNIVFWTAVQAILIWLFRLVELRGAQNMQVVPQNRTQPSLLGRVIRRAVFVFLAIFLFPPLIDSCLFGCITIYPVDREPFEFTFGSPFRFLSMNPGLIYPEISLPQGFPRSAFWGFNPVILLIDILFWTILVEFFRKLFLLLRSIPRRQTVSEKRFWMKILVIVLILGFLILLPSVIRSLG